jgi:TP901-1 family phage major tail protein
MPKNGKDIIYLVQPVNAPIGAEALIPGTQTEGTWTRESSLNDEQTKTGRVLGYGPKTEGFEMTVYDEENDPGLEALDWSYDNEERIKVWRVEKKLNANGQHNARFGYCLIENLEFSDPSEGFVEASVSLPVIGKTQKGELPPLPDSILENSQYEFETPGETGVEAPTTGA